MVRSGRCFRPLLGLALLLLVTAPLVRCQRDPFAQSGAEAPAPAPAPDGTGAAAEDPCLLPPETGVCKAYYLQYFYDAEAGECNAFVWGGCGGNANRFASVAECETACMR